MYTPAAFRQDDLAQLHAQIRQTPLAVLVSHAAGGLHASHLPLLLVAEEGSQGTLYGHFARANQQWQAFAEQPEALAIFSGAEAYVSPGWYPSKAEQGKAVPTWNYISVHARGRLELFDEPARLRQLLVRLTATHESGQAQPWHIDDAPPDYIDAMLRAIVGFALPIEQLQGQWKLSQNRSATDRAGVQQALAASPRASDRELAQQMQAAAPATRQP
ncbi:FMN-binding negative transcriptional regulator [Pseudomonas sp. N040]|uniref:FMN-binding negative transcriptional regulator n=1 Tax=Pseudomonas sp. N040 TaxID=2785325 RepID=UPI0018A26A63|nr:FMN-binding negative transcriptional regulator [Pseudomonas sp. N040]MBF7728974.1 FMN-binding negative transcriptional regulator [Pseudomonas sp. N040]MBW7012614.1 FMN-binding negative transcriptional regulator [Pseudomonas sp. N040]